MAVRLHHKVSVKILPLLGIWSLHGRLEPFRAGSVVGQAGDDVDAGRSSPFRVHRVGIGALLEVASTTVDVKRLLIRSVGHMSWFESTSTIHGRN